jgi:hypothetical protein
MTDALARLRELAAKMTPGEAEFEAWLLDSKTGRSVKDAEQWLARDAYLAGRQSAPGIVAAVRLLRLLADQGTVEVVARMIDPSSWRVFDSYLADAKRKYAKENAGYDPAAFKDKRSMVAATAILTTLAEMAMKETDNG